jgi:hypothetical protein
MKIMLFIYGLLAGVMAVVATTVALGWSVWSIIAITGAILVTGQILYFFMILGDAWLRRVKGSSDDLSASSRKDEARR